MTFHYTGCCIGILIDGFVIYNPHLLGTKEPGVDTLCNVLNVCIYMYVYIYISDLASSNFYPLNVM